MRQKLIRDITEYSIKYLAVMSVPLNLIVFAALSESEYFVPRLVVPVFSLVFVALAVLNKRISILIKIRVLKFIFLSGAVFTLLLGLLDMASLWLVLSIIYTLFISEKKYALRIFVAGLVMMIIAGVLLITKNPYIPLDYNFENCHYACVITRIIHYLMVGYLIFYIIDKFIREIRNNIRELEEKTGDLLLTNEKLYNEMKARKEIQQKLLDTVILTEEKERKRIAGELHDGLGPVLSSINLYFQAYTDEKDPEKQKRIATKLTTIINDAVVQVSEISHIISPDIVVENGLAVALENFVNRINVKKDLDIDLHYRINSRFDIKKEIAAYRVISELINNTLKHAGARHITIELALSPDALTVNYSDDGKGFDRDNVEHFSDGMGLRNMRTRVESLGGEFSYRTAEGEGFNAFFKIPV